MDDLTNVMSNILVSNKEHDITHCSLRHTTKV